MRPDDDETAVTATQVREVITRLREAGHHRDGDPGHSAGVRRRMRVGAVGVRARRSPGAGAGSDAFRPGAVLPGAATGPYWGPIPARPRVSPLGYIGPSLRRERERSGSVCLPPGLGVDHLTNECDNGIDSAASQSGRAAFDGRCFVNTRGSRTGRHTRVEITVSTIIERPASACPAPTAAGCAQVRA